MTWNSFGSLFRFTTFGESHGPYIGVVVDGCPPRLKIDHAFIQSELNRRRPGQSQFVSQRKEPDEIEIISGLFEGLTTGAPITILIKNLDQREKDYELLKDAFRPAHADFTYQKKYGIRDHRGGGRASARETASRVAAGAIAKLFLKENGIYIVGFLAQIGEIEVKCDNLNCVQENSFFIPNRHQVADVERLLKETRNNEDSIGAKVKVLASNVPVGLGAPLYHKLDADLAAAMMGINAAKAVAIGNGFHAATQKGSEFRDAMNEKGFETNHAGGILGGISNGSDVEVEVIFKPTPSIPKEIITLNAQNEMAALRVKGRHDPCVGIRAVPVVEAMMALVLADHLLWRRVYLPCQNSQKL